MLENEIVPLYYAKNTKGYSPEWIQYIKNSIAQITPRYTTKRMLDDYLEKFYNKLAKRSATVNANNFAKAKEIAEWKEKMALAWDGIEIESVEIPDSLIHNPHVGESYELNTVIDVKNADAKAIGVEFVAIKIDKNHKKQLYSVNELDLVKTEGTRLFFKTSFKMNRAGEFKYAFRMFPKNEDLPHRQDFCFVRWF